jgi:hypothetical protein
MKEDGEGNKRSASSMAVEAPTALNRIVIYALARRARLRASHFCLSCALHAAWQILVVNTYIFLYGCERARMID